MPESFTWQDGDRTIRFGRGTLATARELLGEGYVLLTTERAQAEAAHVVAGASATVHVPPGRVDEISAALLDDVGQAADAAASQLLVALGGGRVVDTAKAIAAARGDGTRVAALPTTLSAAEMTRIHRMPAGVPMDTPKVRPAIVINDPALCASQPLPELAASAANSLGHAVEGPSTDLASPVPSLAGLEAIRLTEAAYAGRADDDEPDRDALALAALLSGYSIDANGYGLHHVLSQTLVRVGGAEHNQANAVMLPHSLGALRRRGADLPPAADALARALGRRAGAERARDIGVDHASLDACADAAAQRAELHRTPPAADREELRALYEAAF